MYEVLLRLVGCRSIANLSTVMRLVCTDHQNIVGYGHFDGMSCVQSTDLLERARQDGMVLHSELENSYRASPRYFDPDERR